MKWVGLIITPPQYETGGRPEICVCVPNHLSVFWLFSVGPLSVTVLNRKEAMSAGRRHEALCQVVGARWALIGRLHTAHLWLVARPAPAVTWWKGAQQIRDNISTNVRSIRVRVVTIFLLNPSFSTCQMLSALIITPCQETFRHRPKLPIFLPHTI